MYPLPSPFSRITRWLVRLLALWLMGVGMVVAAEAESVGSPGAGSQAAEVMVIPIRDEIGRPALYLIRRGLKEAIDQGIPIVVFDMETPGGRLDSTFEILKAIEKFPGKTVTYVNREAISAGAIIAAGSNQIYFAPRGIIGAAAPVGGQGEDIDSTMTAKVVSYLQARIRAMSEDHRYRGTVINAMINLRSEVEIEGQSLKGKDELLSLTATEAVAEYGDPPVPLLGEGIATSLEDLVKELTGNDEARIVNFEASWSESFAAFLNRLTPMITGVALLLLFIEFKTPGFGIFGISGIVLIGIVFFSQFVAGLSGHEAAVVFALGILLLAVEIFFFPGTLVAGLLGIALMLGSLIWSMADIWPDQPLELSADLFLGPALNVALSVMIAAVAMMVVVRYLPKGGLWGRMVLDAVVGGEPVHGTSIFGGGGGAAELEAGRARPVSGDVGIAVTPLFPSGQVEIGGKRYEAKVAIGSAARGAKVRVVQQAEFELIVEVVAV